MDSDTVADVAARVSTPAELAGLLRRLRNRQARTRQAPAVTYRELAGKMRRSHGIIGAYLTGKVVPPVDRFDELARLLGATPNELGVLATARDRVSDRRLAQTGPGAPPRQLPAAVTALAGRGDALTALDRHAGRGPVVISSAAGVGKTALAVHWAHRAVPGFPDGQLYATLHGATPGVAPVPAATVLRGFLTALGVPESRLPAGLDVQAGLYRSLLAYRRVLVVLDDARDAGQVRPLLPGTPNSLALITSRNRMTDLVAVDGARVIVLDVLDRSQSRQLLASRLGVHRLAADPAGTDALVTACAGQPRILAQAAARLVTQTGLGLRTVAAELTVGRAPEPGLEAPVLLPAGTLRHSAVPARAAS
jgi:transcriptional regulator with XRE-family HTH domain